MAPCIHWHWRAAASPLLPPLLNPLPGSLLWVPVLWIQLHSRPLYMKQRHLKLATSKSKLLAPEPDFHVSCCSTVALSLGYTVSLCLAPRGSELEVSLAPLALISNPAQFL